MSARWYGSLQNRLAEGAPQPEPYVGMLATELSWSDRHPYEITQVKDARHIYARRLGHKIVSGSCQDGSAEYEYFSKPTNGEIMLFKKKDGRWVQKYEHGGYGDAFALGYAEEYYDPSF